MSSVSKGKSKADPTGPSIRVEETPHELSREERPFRLKRKERLQNLSPIPPSHSRGASRGPSERGKSQEFLSVLETTANPNIGDNNRSIEIENYLGKSFKPADRWMEFERASEEEIVDIEDQSVDFPMSTSEEIAPQDSMQGSKRHVQVKRTIGGGVFRKDKGKGRDNQAKGLGGAGRLAMPGHPRQDYVNFGTPEARNHSRFHARCHFAIPRRSSFHYWRQPPF
ncbi:hypothetical protein M378DRAFT_906174 [Amanita muscaria Koide BX008]|uniref:Uncharacterized protein n=1 Tax=Amanita muscaria (strain Koide BX008) TaxID=946122 RepID=A0A0C2WWL8_AMAMK|nr:hypothetical protein M378DRAFT_906174 [Amanita muscaria Koide BX008]